MRVLESKCTERLVRGEFNESWEVREGWLEESGSLGHAWIDGM